MCRSIKVLRTIEPTTDADIEAAALQFVRKVSGMRHPTDKNRAAFDAAVVEVTGSVERLLASLPASKRQPEVARRRTDSAASG